MHVKAVNEDSLGIVNLVNCVKEIIVCIDMNKKMIKMILVKKEVNKYEDESDEDEDDSTENELERTFINPSQVEELKVMSFRVYVPCRDMQLSINQQFYWREIENLTKLEDKKLPFICTFNKKLQG